MKQHTEHYLFTEDYRIVTLIKEFKEYTHLPNESKTMSCAIEQITGQLYRATKSRITLQGKYLL